ncbi:hypothetical protein M0R45_012084 [Rubus argutus]|uniref:Lachrymatory factor synthase n=1 Tax=Rubus argutus TaxID=59490 RepID=A0AAW1YGC9_RUBAR
MDLHQSKWEGKVSARLTKARADQIWPLFKDFFNFHHWFPTLGTCYGIRGTNGEPGCIRFCAGSTIPSDGGEHVSWSKERLTAVNDAERRCSYEIVDSNIRFKSYVSTVRVVDDDEDGCMIEWSFAVDPVEGLVLEDLVRKYEVGLESMSKIMEDAVVEN